MSELLRVCVRARVRACVCCASQVRVAKLQHDLDVTEHRRQRCAAASAGFRALVDAALLPPTRAAAAEPAATGAAAAGTAALAGVCEVVGLSQPADWALPPDHADDDDVGEVGQGQSEGKALAGSDQSMPVKQGKAVVHSGESVPVGQGEGLGLAAEVAVHHAVELQLVLDGGPPVGAGDGEGGPGPGPSPGCGNVLHDPTRPTVAPVAR